MELILNISLLLATGAKGASGAEESYEWHPPWMMSNRGPKERVQLRGLMNTGTNFLSALLKEVDTVEERKHMFPWLLQEREDFDLVIVRHPMSWITGMQKAPYFLRSRGDFVKNASTKCSLHLKLEERLDVEFDSIVDIWNRYYSAYLSWDTGAVLRYEDLLIDADRSLRRVLGKDFHSKKFHRRSPAKRHGKSRTFGHAKQFNLEKRWMSAFDQTQLGLHCSKVNQSLLETLNYTCP